MLLEPLFDVITAPRHHSLCGQVGDRLALAHNEQLQMIAEDLAEQPLSVRQIASSLGKMLRALVDAQPVGWYASNLLFTILEKALCCA